MNWSREITHVECHSDPAVAGEESLIICEIRSSSNGQGYFASLNMTGPFMRRVLNSGLHLIVLFLSLCMIDNIAASAPSHEMRVTLLGTGTPFPSAERFGSAILVEAAGKRLLFDCGRGVVIRLTQSEVNPKDIDSLFLTHLHSDHVVGIPNLWLSGWFLGRSKPLPIWGPPGTRSMAEHLVQAFGLISVFVRLRPIRSQAKTSKSSREKYIMMV